VASYDEVIQPGQAGQLRVTLHTKDLRGKFTRGVSVSTNDPANRQIHLQVSANVLASVQLMPPALMVGGRRGRLSGKIVVRQDPTETGELEVSGLEVSQPWLTASVRQISEPEEVQGKIAAAAPGDWIIEVELDKSAPWGARQESLTFKTGLGREPEVKVPVKVLVPSLINVNPRELYLFLTKEGHAEGVFLASIREGHEKDELSIDIEPEPFKVAVEKTGARHYRVAVSWQTDDPDAPVHGKAILRLPEGELEVPVHVSMQRVSTDSAKPSGSK
jgi:hypothetical protein